MSSEQVHGGLDIDTTNLVLNDEQQRTLIASAHRYGEAALILSCAGLGWVIIGLSAFKGVPLMTLLLVLVIFAVLLVRTFALRQSLRDFPASLPSPEVEKVLGQATAFELVLIAVAVIASVILHKPMFIMPLVALIVGLHFFPLARVLRRPLYNLTGAALCAIGIAVPLLVLEELKPNHISLWRLVLGLSGGVILWVTTLVLLVDANRLVRKIVQ